MAVILESAADYPIQGAMAQHEQSTYPEIPQLSLVNLMRHIVISDKGQRSQIKHSTPNIYGVTGNRNLRRRWRIKATVQFLKHYKKLVPTLATFPDSVKHASVGDSGMCPAG